jgi:transcriptional regulator with XRE-family HTH domain
MTQEQFAEQVGISVDFLSLIERGVNAPSFETLERITEELQILTKALFEFPNIPNQQLERAKSQRSRRIASGLPSSRPKSSKKLP